MNNRVRLVKRIERDDTIPRYDRKRGYWRAWIDGVHEEGCLEYVCGEFAKSGLFYPVHIGTDETEHDHEHTFAGVLAALLDSPISFSLRGFEEYYSKQELEMLRKVQEKLLVMKKSSSATGTES